MDFWRDATVFNGPLWELLLALALGLIGMFLIRCGVNVCWRRLRRRPPPGPPDTPKPW